MPKNYMSQDNSQKEKNDREEINYQLSGMHHSYDIALVAQLESFEQAVLIHHFQHWIRINRMDESKKKTHIHQGRCWMYQTKSEIQAHFSYMSDQKIRYAIDQLIEKGILLVGNFNKKKFDKTLWYAFRDEKAFNVDEISVEMYYAQGSGIKKMFTKAENRNACAENRYGSADNHKPIPDTIPDTITTDEYNRGKKAVDNSPSRKNESCEQKPQAIAADISTYLLEEIRKRMPGFKQPNLDSWAVTIDRMLRIDKREPFEIMEVITWLKNDDWYAANILSPKSLRDRFDDIKSKMMLKDKKTLVHQNRQYAIQMKQHYSQEMKGLTFNEKCAWNCYDTDNGKEASFDLPHETFKNILMNLFGGKIR